VAADNLRIIRWSKSTIQSVKLHGEVPQKKKRSKFSQKMITLNLGFKEEGESPIFSHTYQKIPSNFMSKGIKQWLRFLVTNLEVRDGKVKGEEGRREG